MAPFRHFLAALAPAVLLVAASGQVTDPASVARRASAAMKGRDFETAERLYSQLSRTFPDEPGLALNLGLARYSSGKFDEALVDLNRFLQAQPDHGPAWLIVGISHQKLDRPHEAVGPLQRAVDLSPGNKIARLELADALLRSGRPVSRLDRVPPAAAAGLLGPQGVAGPGAQLHGTVEPGGRGLGACRAVLRLPPPAAWAFRAGPATLPSCIRSLSGRAGLGSRGPGHSRVRCRDLSADGQGRLGECRALKEPTEGSPASSAAWSADSKQETSTRCCSSPKGAPLPNRCIGGPAPWPGRHGSPTSG